MLTQLDDDVQEFVVAYHVVNTISRIYDNHIKDYDLP
jgi:hypothetical protein